MLHKIYWFVVTYPDGNRQSRVVDDLSDTVQFFNSRQEYFEAEAYYLSTWCDKYGFKYESGSMEVTLPISNL